MADTFCFTHATVLDGTRQMNRVEDAAIVVSDGRIVSVEAHGTAPKGAKEINLSGKYLLPGLINLHCHLAGDGSPQQIDASTGEKIQQSMGSGIGRRIMKFMVQKAANEAFLSGVTTLRTVGGLGTLDAELRDEIASGKRRGPRILSSNQAVSVPGGHMAGTLALIAHSPEEAKGMVAQIAEGKPDLIKLMITGGTLDIEKPGDEGRVLMTPEEVAAAAGEAHRQGYSVAAHIQSSEGIRVALENGVNTIEHGASLDDGLVELFRSTGAAMISTITPFAIMACLPAEMSGLPQLYKDSCALCMEDLIAGFRRAVAEEIPIGLGLDDGSPYVTHYGMWRELDFFTRYIGTDPAYALWCATGQNAAIAGIDGITGTVEPGKMADFVVTGRNPLEDFSALAVPEMVVKEGAVIRRPRLRRKKKIDALVDRVKEYDAAFLPRS